MSLNFRRGSVLDGVGEHLQEVMQQVNRTCTVQAHLLGLPMEILLEIIQYLPPASAKVLSYTCQQLYYWSDAWLSRIDFYPADDFETFCILERAQLIRGFACRRCFTLHSKKMFVPEELKRPPIVRLCVASMPIISVCPRSSVAYRDLQLWNKSLRKLPQYIRFGWASSPECCTSGHKIDGRYNDQQLVVSKDKEGIALLSFLNIWKGAEKDVPDKSEIQEILRSCDFRICPHMILNDTKIGEMYEQNGLFEQGNNDGQAATMELFSDSKDDEVVTCENEHCDTFVQWYYTQDHSPGFKGGWVQILAFRYLGDLKDPLDPRWLVHTQFASTMIPH